MPLVQPTLDANECPKDGALGSAVLTTLNGASFNAALRKSQKDLTFLIHRERKERDGAGEEMVILF